MRKDYKKYIEGKRPDVVSDHDVCVVKLTDDLQDVVDALGSNQLITARCINNCRTGPGEQCCACAAHQAAVIAVRTLRALLRERVPMFGVERDGNDLVGPPCCRCGNRIRNHSHTSEDGSVTCSSCVGDAVAFVNRSKFRVI